MCSWKCNSCMSDIVSMHRWWEWRWIIYTGEPQFSEVGHKCKHWYESMQSKVLLVWSHLNCKTLILKSLIYKIIMWNKTQSVISFGSIIKVLSEEVCQLQLCLNGAEQHSQCANLLFEIHFKREEILSAISRVYSKKHTWWSFSSHPGQLKDNSCTLQERLNELINWPQQTVAECGEKIA